MSYLSEKTELKVLEDLVPRTIKCPLCGGRVYVKEYGSSFSGFPSTDVYFSFKCLDCGSDFNATGKILYYSGTPQLVVEDRIVNTYHNVNGVQCMGEIQSRKPFRRCF